MGMYTEFVFGCMLEKGTPDDVIDVLHCLIKGTNYSFPLLPKHPFFECDRWRSVALCSSYYFGGQKCSEIEYDDISKSWRISIRANLKNYDGEIKKFVDWLRPYIHHGAGRNGLLGYQIYEEEIDPEMFYLNGVVLD